VFHGGQSSQTVPELNTSFVASGRCGSGCACAPAARVDWCKVNGLKLPPDRRPSFDRGSLAVVAAASGLGATIAAFRKWLAGELAR
jgi:hypothetical protein